MRAPREYHVTGTTLVPDRITAIGLSGLCDIIFSPVDPYQ